MINQVQTSQPIVWSPGVTLDEIEKQVILKAYSFYNGNKTATANALGVSVRTIDHKLNRYEEERKEQEAHNAKRKESREAFLSRSRGITSAPAKAAEPRPEPKSDDSSDAWDDVESIERLAQEQTMPMPKRRKIQEVLSK